MQEEWFELQNDKLKKIKTVTNNAGQLSHDIAPLNFK